MRGGVVPRTADEATREAVGPAVPGPAIRGPAVPDTEAGVVTRHLGLVRMVVRRMRGRVTVGFDVDDMTQEGLIGLLRAARRWDPGRGLRFSSLAVPCIRDAISTAWTDRARRRPRSGTPAWPDWEERCLSLDAPLPGSSGRTLGDVMADERAVDPAQAVALADRACRLLQALADLDPMERAVLVHRYGLVGEPLGWPQIAQRLGITAGRARQVEAAALAALREVPSLAA